MLPVISHTSTVEDLFSSRIFIAASVQRTYQWNTSECETLLADLVRAWSAQASSPEPGAADLSLDEEMDADLGLLPTPSIQPALPDYYLGAIVTRTAPDGAVEIYDGLQRITTLTILISVLRDTVDDDLLSQRLDKLINQDGDKPRLLLPERHPALWKEIQKRGEAGKVRRSSVANDFQHRVREAARTFRSAANAWNPAQQASFVEFLLNRVAIVIVHAAAGRLARQIFVTTNLRGLPLNQADLFKGQILDIAPDEATAADMENSWSVIQHAVGNDLVPFLTTVDFITRRQEQSADHLQELIDYLGSKVGPHKINEWLKRLSVFASAWKHLDRKLESPGSTPLDVNIWRLSLFKWQQWKPLALLWHANYLLKTAKGVSSSSETAHARHFAQLHRRCMALTLAGLNQSQRSHLFAQAITQTIKGNNCLSGALLITDVLQDRIEDKLSNPFTDEDRRIVLFRWLESLCWDVPPLYIKDGSIEHVLPQNPHPKSQWFIDFSDEDSRHDSCHSIGNLALIDPETNTRLANADFIHKQQIFLEASGRFRSLQGFEQSTAWTEDDIQRRAQLLKQDIVKQLHLTPRSTPKRRAQSEAATARPM